MREFVEKIHVRAINAVRVMRTGQKDLIQAIQEMDRCHGYRDYTCESLWAYCLKKLNLDESEASALIGIARKSVEVPELKLAVELGQIHISNARQIVPVLNKENQSIWLEKATNLSKRDLQKELADYSPKLATTQKANYVTSTRMQFQCGLDESDFREFLDAQNLVSQSKQCHADYEQTLKELIRFYKQANDPVLKAKRAELRKFKRKTSAASNGAPQQAPALVTATHIQKNRRSYPAELEHQINLRDQRQCTHVDSTNKRCTQKKWLALHHKIPLEIGGQNSFENLQTLCWSHHFLVHNKNSVSDNMMNYV